MIFDTLHNFLGSEKRVDVKEVMRKVISQQMSFGDGFIDASLYELDEELKKVDGFWGMPSCSSPSKKSSMIAWAAPAQR